MHWKWVLSLSMATLLVNACTATISSVDDAPIAPAHELRLVKVMADW
jgi:hypothetical protein